ncbi:hypothetical protein [Exiguobacterium flavidum]|uniref:hypothetical protein n=1 Tax=Exiguobacterium flavidum TaxID=2184695 RepID=UPI001E2C6A19|nr:hypothetical protein [Exiguobacterium flavidum]
MTIMIQPSAEQISAWVNAYVPGKDFYFLRETDLDRFRDDLAGVLVVPRDEFFKHPSYRQVGLANSYEHWNISQEAAYVLVAHPEWITWLSAAKKQDLNALQVEIGRGLVLPVPSGQSLAEWYEHLVEVQGESYLVLHRAMWSRMPDEMRSVLLAGYAKEWDDWTGQALPDRTPAHIRRYANTFPVTSGSNCLAATLFAVSGQEWFVSEWVHQQTFLKGLEQAHYGLADQKDESRLDAGDVVTWVNADGIIQHASYHVGDGMFFNKNGQTFFHPWKIVEWDDLKEQWAGYSRRTYEKKRGPEGEEIDR